MKYKINIVGTISLSEIPFAEKQIKCSRLENAKFFIIKSALTGTGYTAYVYAHGIRNNGTQQNPAKFEAVECFDLFHSWRLTNCENSSFSKNEFLEIV